MKADWKSAVIEGRFEEMSIRTALRTVLLGYLAAMSWVDIRRRCLPRIVLLGFVACCAAGGWLEVLEQAPGRHQGLQLLAGRLVVLTVLLGLLWLLEQAVACVFRQESAIGAGDYYVIAGLALVLRPAQLMAGLSVASLAPVAVYAFRRLALKEKAPDKTFAWVPYLLLGVLVALAIG